MYITNETQKEVVDFTLKDFDYILKKLMVLKKQIQYKQ